MNKAIFAAGGIILIAGGIAYWYFSKDGPAPPPPPPPPGCTGSCFYEGATDCDSQNNLCRCVNGQWTLLESNSDKCISGLKHNECFPSANDIITCIPVPGAGADLCPDIGFSTGCSCVSANCDTFHLCEPRDYKCCLKAQNLTISASDSNWTCSPIAGGGNECIYELGKQYAATTLIGVLNWKWGFPLLGMTWAIRGRYNNEWRVLKDGAIVMVGTEGTESVVAMFVAQGIDALKFETYAVCNVKPNSFIGHMSY